MRDHDIKKLSDGSKYVTDKLPFNFKWIGFIKLILPNAKIIHCIRDPRDTCLSIFKNYFPYRAMGFAYSIKDIVSYYKSYRTLMKYWKENFNFEIYDIYYEDLIGSSHFEIKKLINEKGYLDQILAEGAQKANDIASNKIKEIHKIIENPRILESPIIVTNPSAVIGRPPENILKLFNK